MKLELEGPKSNLLPLAPTNHHHGGSIRTEKVVKLGQKYSTMAVDDEIFGTE